MMKEITINAPAKINLTLDVGAKRTDGYHEIRSVMQTISLHDTLTVRLMPNEPGVRSEVFGEESLGVPADESNLVHRAAVRLQKTAAARGILPGNKSGLHIRLEKRIPSQAGLGGGSSDAATTLLAIDKLFALNLPIFELQKMGAMLGADVPFFLVGGTALVEGLGERVTPLPSLEPRWDLLIVKPAVGVSTATAYAALDIVLQRIPGQATSAWLSGTQIVQNDFMQVALDMPEIAAISLRLEDYSPMLCGSGSALFCRVCESEGKELAEHIQREGLGKVWLTRTMGRGNE
jgi:4-diphosphocytidyl-2-C-methyl-D-erythritol kinase